MGGDEGGIVIEEEERMGFDSAEGKSGGKESTKGEGGGEGGVGDGGGGKSGIGIACLSGATNLAPSLIKFTRILINPW